MKGQMSVGERPEKSQKICQHKNKKVLAEYDIYLDGKLQGYVMCILH